MVLFTYGMLICWQQTMKAVRPINGYATFCVADLSSHPDFRDLAFVKGAPGFKYYAGTPLITLGGVCVGTLFVMDTETKTKDLSQAEVTFLGVMASNVMKYLEMRRENGQRKRNMIMSKGLAAFVEGRRRIPADWKSAETASTGTSNSHAESLDIVQKDESSETGSFESDSISEGRAGTPNEENRQKKMIARLKTRTTGLVGRRDSIQQSEADTDASLHETVLARASNLLRESLDVDFTVFFDTNSDAKHDAAQLDSQDGKSCTALSLEWRTDYY